MESKLGKRACSKLHLKNLVKPIQSIDKVYIKNLLNRTHKSRLTMKNITLKIFLFFRWPKAICDKVSDIKIVAK